jgi:hypothetical protein
VYERVAPIDGSLCQQLEGALLAYRSGAIAAIRSTRARAGHGRNASQIADCWGGLSRTGFEPERDPRPVLAFVLDGRSVPDRGVQPAVVEPADVLDGRELELRVGAPHAVGDQLGLVGVHERFAERVVVAVSDATDRREHAMVVEHLRVVLGGVLARLNRSSQHWGVLE